MAARSTCKTARQGYEVRYAAEADKCARPPKGGMPKSAQHGVPALAGQAAENPQKFEKSLDKSQDL